MLTSSPLHVLPSFYSLDARYRVREHSLALENKLDSRVLAHDGRSMRAANHESDQATVLMTGRSVRVDVAFT